MRIFAADSPFISAAGHQQHTRVRIAFPTCESQTRRCLGATSLWLLRGGCCRLRRLRVARRLLRAPAGYLLLDELGLVSAGVTGFRATILHGRLSRLRVAVGNGVPLAVMPAVMRPIVVAPTVEAAVSGGGVVARHDVGNCSGRWAADELRGRGMGRAGRSMGLSGRGGGRTERRMSRTGGSSAGAGGMAAAVTTLLRRRPYGHRNQGDEHQRAEDPVSHDAIMGFIPPLRKDSLQDFGKFVTKSDHSRVTKATCYLPWRPVYWRSSS